MSAKIEMILASLSSLASLLAPPTCVCCGRDLVNGILCSACLDGSRPLLPPLCRKCRLPLGPRPAKHKRCRRLFKHCGPVYAAAPFQSPLGIAVKRWKYHGSLAGRDAVAQLVARAAAGLARELAAFDAMAYVPLHPLKRLWRGFNQASDIAAMLAARLGLPLLPGALCRTRLSVSQTRKDRLERRAIKEVFTARPLPGVRGRRILLVDDIVTTGATVEACALALKKAGAESVGVFSVLRTV